ncbi:hypothetical protein MHI37_19630 [Paenibacillus sp. FSL H8-0548]|uniref:hypothetical protein n=1 Tax=Paenibacillus sp. FSL H8-0548 TaxID=1920422 RepID=UPI00117F8347|nr:hypothetical protein [Paenibacillus sp. FSL H8-0548]
MSFLKLWHSLPVWIVMRSISIPMAIIIGFLPLWDGRLDRHDIVFPVFFSLSLLSQLRIRRLKEMSKVKSDADSSDLPS